MGYHSLGSRNYGRERSPSTHWRGIAVIAMVVCLGAVGAIKADVSDLNLTELIDRIRLYKQQTVTYDVGYTIEVSQSTFMGEKSEAVSAKRVSQGHFIHDLSTGRLRQDVDKSYSWNRRTKQWDPAPFSAAIDGERYVSLRNGTGVSSGAAAGSKVTPQAVVTAVDTMKDLDIGYTPRFFSSRLGPEYIDDYLQTRADKVTSVTKLDPFRYRIVLESPQTEDDPAWRREITIDSRHDWGLTDTRMFDASSRLVSEKKLEYSVVDGRSFPTSGTYVEYRDKDSSAPTLEARYTTEEGAVHVNQPVKDSDFVIVMPAGTHLIDRRTGLDVKIGDTEDILWDPVVLALLDGPGDTSAIATTLPTTDRDATAAKGETPTAASDHVGNDDHQTSHRLLWIGAAATVCIVGGLVFLMRRRRG